jgi:hypothetical protein
MAGCVATDRGAQGPREAAQPPPTGSPATGWIQDPGGSTGQLPQTEQDPQPELRHFEPFLSRWYAPGRPVNGVQPLPYDINEPAEEFNPYRQNVLKGDFPIAGSEDLFVNFTLTERFLFESRNVPTPTGITGPGPVDPNFFGSGKQKFFINDLALTIDLFKEQQAFKPVQWRLRVTPVLNLNYLNVNETGVVNINVNEGTIRRETDVALQEAFFEYHLLDLSDRYDFLSAEAGILPFRSDFRGFIFDDTNLGVRLFGNADNNKWQYNLAYFDMLDKNTNSLLNEFESRDQNIFIANVYRQDWPVLGYTTSFSFHYNDDHRQEHFDDNGFLVAPAPVGLAQPGDIDAFYLGWAGEGHVAGFNVTHAFYQALGEDSNNPFAGRSVDINAQLLALELSYDIDWWRPRLFGFFTSGDDDPRDGQGRGFDAILDAPNFAGGQLSFFNREAIRLLGVNLTNVLSPIPDLQSSKFQGHSNFVNPGLLQFGGAITAELTPKWRAEVGGSYLRFQHTEPLETYLQLSDIDNDIGVELFLGTQYRPLLNNNIIMLFGATALIPGEGIERIYQSDETLYAIFTDMTFSW